MRPKISIYRASALVVANMIGIGVFTSLGFQLQNVHNTISIILLWVLGGIMALLGAFAYAELGTHFKESGGDYIYLSRVFHPILGYLSAWAGLNVGFSAPVALAAMAFTHYLSPFGLQNNMSLASILIILIGLSHSFSLGHSARIHNISTLSKVLFIWLLIGLGFSYSIPRQNVFLWSSSWKEEIWKPGFTVASCLFIKMKSQESFTSPGNPWLQILFLVVSLRILVYTAINRPWESLIGMGILAFGVLVYGLDQGFKNTGVMV